MTDTTHENHSQEPEREGLSLGSIVFGLILLAIGVIWLLDVADIVDVTWTFVGAVLLILVGLGLIIGARQGSQEGLIFLGIVLSVFVVMSALATFPGVTGGIGDRTESPATMAEVEDTYNWGMGNHTLDLRDVDFPPGETRIDVRLGMGQSTIQVPENVGVRVEWQIGAGNIEALDRDQSGAGLNDSYESDNFAGQDSRLVLDLQIGLGSAEVTR